MLRDDARQDRSVLPNQWTLITAELVHPFEAVPQLPAAVPDVAAEQASMPLTDPEVVTIVERICGVLGVPVPRVLISEKSGHACAPGLIQIGESGLTDYAGPDREALLAHCCGHLLLPHAGELSADRVAALYQGSADAITRVIFADAVHSGAIEPDPAVRVREIQAWSATSGFARLVTSVATAARP